MAIDTEKSANPSGPGGWRINFRWVVGILLVFVSGATLTTYNIMKITDEKPAVEMMATMIASAFSREGLDNEKDIIVFKNKLRKNPRENFQPVPGLQITVKYDNIKDLPPREARLYFFRQLTRPIYLEGAAGLAALAKNKELKKSIEEGVGPLTFLSLKTHNVAKRIFIVLLSVSGALFVLLILLSYRFGKLISPAAILLIASLPGAAIFTFLRAVSGNAAAAKPPKGEDVMGTIGYVASNVLKPTVNTIWYNCLAVFLGGAGLFFVALLSWLSLILWKKAHCHNKEAT